MALQKKQSPLGSPSHEINLKPTGTLLSSETINPEAPSYRPRRTRLRQELLESPAALIWETYQQSHGSSTSQAICTELPEMVPLWLF